MPTRNRGKFDDSRSLSATIRFRRMEPGDPIEVGTRSRRRDWWRRGWAAYTDEMDPSEWQVGPNAGGDDEEIPDGSGDGGDSGSGDGGPDDGGDTGSGDGGDESGSGDDETEPTPVSAEAGATGWWIVTFSDGSTQNMRKTAVIELGLSVGI